MNNIHKYKTSFIAKATTLASLLIFLSIGTAWGQQEQLEEGETYTLYCGTRYHYIATDEGSYIFRNNTGSDITISVTVNALRSRSSYGIGPYTYDYVRIGDTDYRDNSISYNGTSCDNYSRYGSNYNTYPGSGTVQVTIINGRSTTFRIIKDITDNGTDGCQSAGFTFDFTQACPCPSGTPTLTYPTNGNTLTSTQVTLDWNDVNYATGYTVRITNAGGTTVHTETVTNSRLENLSLVDFTPGTYTWTVTPTTNAQGCTLLSASRTFVIPCPECPTIIEPADNAIITGNSATLDWNDVDNATYSVAVTKDGEDDSEHTDLTTSELDLNNLTPGTYTWTLSFIAEGCTVSCEERTFVVIDNLDCIDQSGLVPQNGTVLGSRWVSWNPVPYADKYTIYLAPTSVGIGNVTNPSSAIYTTTTTSTEHLLPMIPQGDYYWTVIPENTALGIKATDCPIYTFTIRYASTEDHDISPSTQGKEFFFSLMENGYDYGGGNKYTAIVAPKEDAKVTFHYYANDTDVEYIVTANTTREIILDENLVYHPNVGDTYKNRTVRVTSTADISLYIANEAENSFDASIVLPSTALGTDYRIQTFPSGNITANYGNDYTSYACFMIVATKENTRVKIEGANGINPSAPEVLLQEGESYFVRKNNYTNNDLSGVRIYVSPREGNPEDSCKTIAVFNGSTVTGVPTSMTNNYDHLVEQAYPISNWGTEFAITSTDGYVSFPSSNLDVDYIRITAAEATTGTINDGTTTTSFNLAAGATHTYQLHRSKGSCYIETNKPVACYLYQRSASQEDLPNDNMGDPSMVWIAPIERGIEKITFSTFKATDIRDTNHWVNIVIPADALDIRTSGRDERKTVWLGNTDITQKFQTSGTLNYVKGSNNKYAYARVKINHGTYTVYSNCGAKMVLHVYGLGNVRGYAYNAGSAAVPYKSAFSIGDGEREFDMTALPEDYHFCSGQKYVFRVSSNGNIDSVIFDFQNGERRKKVITPQNDTIHHTITQGGDYRIISYVFSTVYNHDLCQKEIVVDTVEDHTYIFLSSAETVNDSVCYNTPYTYTRTYWVYDSEGNLQETTFTHNFNTAYESNQTLHINDAKSQYGCDIDLTINLKVFGEMKPGTIGSEEVKCQEGSDGSANLSVTMLTNSASASGGPSDAHYEWQKRRITSIAGTDTTWADTDWITLSNQTNPTYTVTEPAAYRRVYTSATCGTVYSNLIYVSQAGSFVPGTHIDEVVRVCNYETVSRTIGGELSASSIQQDGGVYYVVVSTNGTPETIRLVIRWEKSEGTQDNWQTINGATSYNYTINQTFSISTYFRRIIDLAVTDCNLNLSMGVFAVEVKPDYTITMETLSGCYNGNNASALLTISGGSGSFGVTYKLQNSSDSRSAVLEGGKYKCSPLNQGVNYTYTVVDNTYGCTKTGTINIANPTPLSVATATPTSACQGSPINLPIPAISGGNKPYSVTITSTGLGIVEARPIQVEVNTNDATTTSYNVPMDVSAESKTLGYVIRDVNNCRVASDQTVVTIEKVPEFNLSNTDLTSCEAAKVDATITATVTNATGSPKYDYQINYGSFNADNKTSATHTFGAATAGGGLPQGVYNITVIDENTINKCSATKEHEIKSNFVPTVVLVVPELTMVATNQYSGCPNKNITVSVSAINSTPIGNIADNTYQYSIDGINYGDDYSFQTKTLNKCGSQTISVSVKEVSTGCIFKQDLSIIIEDGIIPTIDASLTNMDVTTYFCPTYTVPEVDSIKNNIKNYIRDNCASYDDLSVSVTPNTGTFNVTDGAQSVTITVKDLCGNTASKQITIKPKPWPIFKINGIPTNGTDNNCYCHGDNITLTAVLEDGDIGTTYNGASYQWYKLTSDVADRDDESNWNLIDEATEYSYTVTTSADGSHAGTYRLEITDPKGCKGYAYITICVHEAIKFHLE